jgi:peptidoglycan/LPS O-acetylase OafA/YrhL
MSKGMGFGSAICLVLTGTFILSCLLHFLVEIPSSQYGKRWAMRLMQSNKSKSSVISVIESEPESVRK